MNIKNKKIKHILEKIYNSDFNSNDIGMLFIWLRPVLSGQDHNALLDIANFVAHSDERDRGISYKYIHEYTENLIRVSEKGGQIRSTGVYSKILIIEQLVKVCQENLDFSIIRYKILNNTEKIINCIIDLMEDVEFKFDDPRVKKCSLVKSNNDIYFQLRLQLRGPRIIISEGAKWQVSLFSN